MEIDYNLIYYLIWEKMLRKIIITSDHNTVNNIINKFKKQIIIVMQTRH